MRERHWPASYFLVLRRIWAVAVRVFVAHAATRISMRFWDTFRTRVFGVKAMKMETFSMNASKRNGRATGATAVAEGNATIRTDGAELTKRLALNRYFARP
jgi:hypothetical protein